MKLIIKLCIVLFLSLYDCKQCPDHREGNNGIYEWSFYYTDKPTVSKIYFSHDGGAVETDDADKNVYYHLFKKIKAMANTKILLFSDKGAVNTNYGHHKSIVVLTGTKGFVLQSTYPHIHNAFLDNTDMDKGLSDTQHMICYSLETQADIDNLLRMYKYIQPFVQAKLEGDNLDRYPSRDTDAPNFGMAVPFKFTSDANCKDGVFGDHTTEESDEEDATIDLLDFDKKGYDTCFKEVPNNIGQFKFYATISQEYINHKGALTVADFGVDSWWKLTRLLEEKFFIISHTHPNKGLGSILHNNAMLINVVWDYGDEQSENFHHDKLAFSFKEGSTKVCFGDGNRDYTQTTRSGLIACIDNANLHSYLRSFDLTFLNEGYQLLGDMTDELYTQALEGATGKTLEDLVYIDSKRKLIFQNENKKRKEIKPLLARKKKNSPRSESSLDEIMDFSDEEIEVTVREALHTFIDGSKRADPLAKEIQNEEVSVNRLFCFICQNNFVKQSNEGIGMKLKCPKSNVCKMKTFSQFSFKVESPTTKSIGEKLMEFLEYLYLQNYITDDQIIAMYKANPPEQTTKKKSKHTE
ncbi:hypothetical protein DLAC_06284 [Tieghemostelium lacteum]|uniref:Uncharacterized protein n=1 Tax=Tieghemostelium lacteum TaxID=361077 RepID=A0A151ZEE7_TIELA|nr:hypothetical protein DLAC_06284 [Tieghemostelium lacteum]|eukprot:KYQ92321.1 hypothetical protein DLAC_06284 [Tieghemostelium lacteum]